RLSALASERDRVAEAETRFRDELAETGRMATLGLYTTSVAHELRGPAGALVLQHEELRAISQQLAILVGPFDPTIGSGVADLSELVADMGVAVQRIRDTVAQLTTLGRRETNIDLVRLSDVVRESLTIARPHLARRSIVLAEELDPECFTRGRRDNLGQVVLNLVLNAADATAQTSSPRIWVRVSGEPGQVVLSVEDNGPGVEPHAIAEIFKPFFTTKKRGQGTGLGLKICSDVVTSHGGHIEVDRRPGGGARFRVVLPRMASRASFTTVRPGALNVPQETPLTPAVQHRVLVIDDDPIFARTLKRALRPHDVRSTASAGEAEIALLDPDYTPDLVLCDVLLPGANGNVLHARIAERRPDVAARFVFVTGGGLAKDEADYLRSTGCLTL
ncbi:MAG TPA: hybrid sensor histidine kinase/response regulator, partial [Polyangiales bacterium]|nr:hybrid sensor histidine kinase/response regulator [Polyangiales bacterium]